MNKILEFLGMILCGLAALVGLLAGGIVLVVASLFGQLQTSDQI